MKCKTYYYVGGNTANGYINLIRSNVSGMKYIIALSHPSLRVKTDIVKQVIAHFESTHELEVICSAFGKDFLDGVIVRDASLAVLSKSIVTPELENVNHINVEKQLKGNYRDIIKETTFVHQYMKEAYDHFSTGLRIHDDLEKIYIDEMDFLKADQIADQFIIDLFKDVQKNNRESIVYRRLFGTSLAEGAVTVVPELTDWITNRCYTKGRAGTGKSYFMKRIMAKCEEYGLDLEIYYCSFDPKSIDMVIVRDLDFCMFDSTDPHEFFPERPGDFVVDLYEETVTPGTDEKFAEEINSVNTHYKSFMKKGIESIKQADMYREKIENKFTEVTEADLRIITTEILKKF